MLLLDQTITQISSVYSATVNVQADRNTVKILVMISLRHKADKYSLSSEARLYEYIN